MDGLETSIATYLTIDGRVFIAPQFDIKWEMNEGGSCPDFVALDFGCNEVVVVEVTAAVNWKPLAARVKERQVRWFSPALRRLTGNNVINPDWRIRFLGFVRRDARNELEKRFADAPEVTFAVLEDCITPWLYWNDRMNGGLPGNGRKPVADLI